MAAEPVTIIITMSTDFDGFTPFEATRDDFTNGPDSRVYRINLSGPYGRIGPTFFDLFKGERPKLVGIASNRSNPTSVARVVADPNNADAFRTEVDLQPEMQYVMMYAGDELAIVTNDGRTVQVTLVVNELSEAEHLQYAMRKPPALTWRRYRIVRAGGTGFELGLANGLWRPSFEFNQSHQVLIAHDTASGRIPLSSFCTYPHFAGCLVRARFANIQTKGHMHIVDATTGAHRSVGGVNNMRWTRVAMVSHDDGIAFRSGIPIVDDRVAVDVMVARVNPESLLQGLYDRNS